MKYVDGFVIVIPEQNLAAYAEMAKKAGKVWMEHGALEFIESRGEDLVPVAPGQDAPMCGTFPGLLNTSSGETVLFSFIVYKSRAHRDRVNKKVMEDPRMKDMCDPGNMPFQMDRMHFGGFEAIVEGKAVTKAPAKAKKKTAKKKAKTAKKSKAKARR